MEPATSSLFVHQKIVVDTKQTHYRLDKLLMERLPSITRTRLQAGIRQGCILVNEKQVKPSYKVKPHDNITIVLPTTTPRTTEVLPENIPLSIVYEDEALLLVNKSATMVVHPAHGNWTGTLVNALVYHFKQLPTQQGNEGRPGLVHRIDKGTSGLLVVAKTEESLAGLSKQFVHHTIQRKYHALVWGTPKEDTGTISVPIKRSTHDRRIMVTCNNLTGAKTATTHYQVLQKLGYVTLVECTLETGRTHQIRAHMKHLGHPLFGDTRYGGDELVKGPRFSKYKTFVTNCFKILPHQALHAISLGFVHPTTQKKMFFETPLPTTFAKVVDKWVRYTASNYNTHEKKY